MSTPDQTTLRLVGGNSNVAPFVRRAAAGDEAELLRLFRGMHPDTRPALLERAKRLYAVDHLDSRPADAAPARRAPMPDARPALASTRVALTGPKVLRMFPEDRPAVKQSGRRGRRPRNVVRLGLRERLSPGDIAVIWNPEDAGNHGKKVCLVEWRCWAEAAGEWRWKVECPAGISFQDGDTGTGALVDARTLRRCAP